MKTNYKGRFDKIKHNVEETREQDAHMHEQMTMMTAEIESLTFKKNLMVELYDTEMEENKKHLGDLESLQEENLHLKEYVGDLEHDKRKKEKLHELVARDLKESALKDMEMHLKEV